MEWLYIINPFEAAAKENIQRAYKFSEHSDATLKAKISDPFFNGIYSYYHPLHDAMWQEWSLITTHRATRMGATKRVKDLLKKLRSENIDAWDAQIRVVFAKGSPDYIALMPNGRAHFSRGAYIVRLTAVGVLGKALTGIAALASLKTEVDNFHDELNQTIAEKEGAQSTVVKTSRRLTEKQKAAMQGLYVVLAELMKKYADNPKQIKPFFDISTIRNKAQKLYVSTVKEGEEVTKFIFKRTVNPEQKVKIKVLSRNALDFSIADDKKHFAAGNHITVEGESEQVIDAGAIKHSHKSAFFMVRNRNQRAEGHFQVELL